MSFLDDPKAHVFMVTGEPGMGKSRVLKEVMNSPLFEGDKLFAISFVVYQNETIKTLLLFWLEDLLSKISLFKGNKKRWKEILGAIPQFGGALALFIKDASRPDERKFIEALDLVSGKLKAHERLVIVIDPYVDLKTHENAQVIEQFAAECPAKVKFIVAQRPDDVLVSTYQFQLLVGKNKASVGMLTEGDVGEILCDDPALCAVGEKDRKEFTRKTGGWPLALDTYASEIADAGENVASIIAGIPDALETAIREQYEGLGENARAVADMLSLLGIDVDLSLLAGLTEIPINKLAVIVDEKATRKLIEHLDTGQHRQHFRIRHALYADWIKNLLAKRIGLTDPYQKIAAFFKQRYDNDANSAQDLIHYVNFLYLCGNNYGFIKGINDVVGDLYRLAQYATMLDVENKRLEISREIRDQKKESEALNNIGLVYKAWGKYDQALGYMEKDLEISREIGDRQGEGTTLNNISQLYRAWGKNDQALEYLEKSLEIRREIGDRAGEGVTLNNISALYHDWGKYDQALKYMEKSLEIQREIGDRKGEGATLNNISQVYDSWGKYDQALEYMEKSLEISREIGDRKGEGTTLNNISQVYDAWGKYDEALKYLRKSLKIRREIGDRAGEAVTRFNIACILEIQGQIAEAIEMVESTVAIEKETRHPNLEAHKAYLEKLKSKL